MKDEIFIRRIKLTDRGELQKIAEEYLVPLYGDQSKALHGWLTGSGYKTSYVAVDKNNQIMGLLVISDKPYREYVKISTLLVLRGFRRKRIGQLFIARKSDGVSKEFEKRQDDSDSLRECTRVISILFAKQI